MPMIYRWAYEYSPSGHADDFVPQDEPPTGVPDMEARTEAAPAISTLPANRVRM